MILFPRDSEISKRIEVLRHGNRQLIQRHCGSPMLPYPNRQYREPPERPPTGRKHYQLRTQENGHYLRHTTGKIPGVPANRRLRYESIRKRGHLAPHRRRNKKLFKSPGFPKSFLRCSLARAALWDSLELKNTEGGFPQCLIFSL